MRAIKTVVFGVLTLSAAMAQEVDWRFAHPGATLVGGLRVHALLESPILNKLIAGGKDQTANAMFGLLRTSLNSVSAINISVMDMGAKKDPDVLMLITGTMDEAAASALAQQGKVKTKRIDANHILVGQGFMLDDAVRRMGDTTKGFQSHAIDRARAIQNYDLWLAGSLPNTPMTAILADMLKGLSLGVSVQNDLRVELALDTASEQMATELVKQARESQKSEPALQGASIEAVADGSIARLRFTVSGDKVVQAVQDGIGGGQFSVAPGLLGGTSAGAKPAAVTITPAAPPKPERKTIIIYGLDDGTRVIDPDKR